MLIHGVLTMLKRMAIRTKHSKIINGVVFWVQVLVMNAQYFWMFFVSTLFAFDNKPLSYHRSFYPISACRADGVLVSLRFPLTFFRTKLPSILLSLMSSKFFSTPAANYNCFTKPITCIFAAFHRTKLMIYAFIGKDRNMASADGAIKFFLNIIYLFFMKIFLSAREGTILSLSLPIFGKVKIVATKEAFFVCPRSFYLSSSSAFSIVNNYVKKIVWCS
jgi:hypothetical protein